MSKVNIVCVLKSGGDFKPEHVARLYRQVCQHMSLDFNFWCLTDYPSFTMPAGVLVLPLTRGWPGWWSKLELFDHFERAFYMDLDTTVVGDIGGLALNRPGFSALHDFDTTHHKGKLASGVMRWQGDYGFITRRFAQAPQEFMAAHRIAASWGDQGFLHACLSQQGVPFGFLQLQHPGKIVSYKLGTQTPETAIICHHGKPRPWEV
jgi:hypothetical protein